MAQQARERIIMATAANDTKSRTTQKPAARKTAPKSNGSAPKRKTSPASRRRTGAAPHVPTWVGVTASVVGASLAAGYFAWRYYQSHGHWPDSFNAAFADGETDEENFDQTRNAGTSSMKSDPDDWEDIDDMSDASFPASDPPSFNPGTA
jgi:hypothetical protein